MTYKTENSWSSAIEEGVQSKDRAFRASLHKCRRDYTYYQRHWEQYISHSRRNGTGNAMNHLLLVIYFVKPRSRTLG